MSPLGAAAPLLGAGRLRGECDWGEGARWTMGEKEQLTRPPTFPIVGGLDVAHHRPSKGTDVCFTNFFLYFYYHLHLDANIFTFQLGKLGKLGVTVQYVFSIAEMCKKK